jgi:hypothetical protein
LLDSGLLNSLFGEEVKTSNPWAHGWKKMKKIPFVELMCCRIPYNCMCKWFACRVFCNACFWRILCNCGMENDISMPLCCFCGAMIYSIYQQHKQYIFRCSVIMQQNLTLRILLTFHKLGCVLVLPQMLCD